MYFHQSTHGVAAVKGALRSAQDVQSLDVIEIEIERALVEVWNVVYIHAYRRGVDARTDASDVHGRGKA